MNLPVSDVRHCLQGINFAKLFIMNECIRVQSSSVVVNIYVWPTKAFVIVEVN